MSIEKHDFTIPFHDYAIEGETLGELTSKKAVVLAHGFGATRYGSKNLLLDIGKELAKVGYLVFMFDFNQYRPNGKKFIPSLGKQTRMHKAVLEYVRHVYQVDDITLVAHSLGCISAARNCEGVQNTILIAPPVRGFWFSVIGNYVKRFSELSLRRDGGMNLAINNSTESIVLDKRFVETARHARFDKIYVTAYTKSSLHIVEPTYDDIVPNMDHSTVRAHATSFLSVDDTHSIPGVLEREKLMEYIFSVMDIEAPLRKRPHMLKLLKRRFMGWREQRRFFQGV